MAFLQSQQTNFALASNGATVSASSTYVSQTPGYAINGDRKGLSTSWWTDDTSSGYPDWIEVAFAEEKTISEIDVFGLQQNYANPVEPTEQLTSSYALTNFEVQYWTGGSWATVAGGAVSGNDKVWKKFTFTPLNTSKIRLNITNVAGDNHSQVVEVEAWGTSEGPANVALASNGATATASSTLAGQSASLAINDDHQGVGSAWWADNTSSIYPDWIQVDFAGWKTITEIDIFGLQQNYSNPIEPTADLTSTYALTNFEVQYWTGGAWATVPGGVVTGNDKVWKKFTFAPLTTSRIRVHVTSVAGDNRSQMVEVEAWGTTATGGSTPSEFAMARLDPLNRTGTGSEDLLSNNFHWSLPLVSLPGRGLDLGLTLSYNSLVWTRSGNFIDFDVDKGSIAPGFRLGFPTIEGPYWNNQANANFYLLVTPAGARVELRHAGAGSTVYESKDSSYLRLTDNLDGTMTLRPTDGSQMNYIAVDGSMRCSKITDRNGNYLSVTYKSWGEIETVTDTLGRVLTFNYDGNLNIQSITQNWAGLAEPHQWATFGWGTVAIGNNFPGLNNLGPNQTTIPVLTRVGLPDGSAYTFGYTAKGQVSNISRAASDTFNHSYTVYEYGASSDDCPRVTEKRVWATNWSDQEGVPHEVVSSFARDADGNSRMTMPDGTVYKEFYGSGWQNGLTTETRNYASVADANADVWQKRTTTSWTQDNTSVSYLTNPRVTETNVYDVSGNRRRTTIDYGPYAQYSLPSIVKEYAGDATTELRRTQTDYNLSQTYLDRRIIGLVSESKLYDATANQWQAKTTYSYDDGSINSQATTGTQHDQAFSSSFTTRGNVTSVSRWDVSDIDNSSKKLTRTATYDAAGSVLTNTDPAGHTSSISYADSFSDNVSRNTFAYATTVTDADGFSSSVQYKFEFGAQTRVQTPLPNVTTNQPGPVTTFAYDAAGRIQQATSLTNGAYTRYAYGADYVETFTTVNNIADEAYTFQLLNGRGQTFISGGNHPGSAGGYRAQTTYYDVMGRVKMQSNPTEINGSWAPSGDDAYNAQADTGGWRFTQQSYDWNGRPRVTTNVDGTYKEASYAGCGCAGGEVVTLTDEVGRRQKVYRDVLGRTWKSEVLNWDGTVYSTTTQTLNARDQATLARQYAGTDQSITFQDTTMSYDGYGRLQSKHVPEQTAGTATVYAYNADDTIQSVTDARGAIAAYGYNNRHLVTSINYSAPTGITPTSNVTFGYDAAGNRTSMTDGLGTQTYSYDSLSRMTSESRGLNGIGPFTLSYQYNLAGELAKVTDASNTTINYTCDSAGRTATVTGSDNLFAGVSNYVSNLQYRAWGGLKSLTDGTGHVSSLAYNARLLPTQFEISGNVVHQNLDYFNDGRISFAHNTTDDRFDRSYTYDQVGRLTENKTGGQARGDSGTSPYYESFGYDPLNNLTARASQTWNGLTSDSDGATYTNNRRAGWGYDADGRNATIDTRTYTYNSAGQQVLMTGQRMTPTGQYNNVSQDSGYDGDGAKVSETTFNVTTYYLRSSVLGGAVVEELSSNGQKKVGYVYLGGQVIATQTQGAAGEQVIWRHNSRTSLYQIYSNSSYISRTEFEAMGGNVSLEQPSEIPPSQGDGDINANLNADLVNRFANFTNLAAGCTSSVSDASCSQVMSSQGYLDAKAREFFGYRWFDLPGNSNEAAQGEMRHGMLMTGFDPAFNRIIGTATLMINGVAAGKLKNPTLNQLAALGQLANQINAQLGIGEDGHGPDSGSSDIGTHDVSVPYNVTVIAGAAFLGTSQNPPLHCQPDVIKAMKKAWSQSSNGTSGVEAGFRLDGIPSNYKIVPNAFTNQQRSQTMTIFTGGPNRTFAIFHVHPIRGGKNPSTPDNNYLNNGEGDTGLADRFKIDFYVMHRDGLTMYNHKTKQTTTLRENLDWTKPCK